MHLDITLIITVLGTLITIVSIFLVFKFRTKPRLAYIKNYIISPIKIVKNINDIQILYKNEPIAENLFLLNCTLINIGNVDIDNSTIYEKLSINLPQEFKILSYKIVNKSKKLELNVISNNNLVSFEWDLFKPKEFFTIETLIEYRGNDVKIDEKKLKKLEFEYRIKDINSIETI